MTEGIPLEQQLKAAHEELHCLAIERDEALKALHMAEWNLHAVGKDGTTTSSSSSSSINLESKFQYLEIIDEIKAKLQMLETRDTSAEAREKAIMKVLETRQSASTDCKPSTEDSSDKQLVNLGEKLRYLDVIDEIKAKLQMLETRDISAEAREKEIMKVIETRSIDNDSNNNKECDTKISNMTDQIASLKLSLEKALHEKAVVEEESISKIDVLNGQVNVLMQSVKTEQENGLANLQTMEKEYATKLADLSSEKAALITSLQNVKDESGARIAAIEEESKAKESSIAEQIVNFENELKASKETIEEYANKLTASEKAKDDASHALKQAQELLEKERKKLVDAKAQETAIVTKLEAAAKAAESIAKEALSKLQSKFDASESTLKSQVSTLESKLSKVTEQLSTSSKEVAELKSKLAAAEGAAHSHEQRLEKVSRLLTKLQSTEVENQERSRQLETQLSSLQEREVEVTRREENSKRTNEGLEKKVSTLKASKQALQSKADTAEARAVQAEINAAAAEKAKLQAEADVARLTEKFDELYAKMATERTRQEGQSTEVATTSGAVSEKEKEKGIEKQKAAKKNAVSEKPSLAVVTIREELARERLHKVIAIISSVMLLIVLLSMVGYNIMSDLAASRRY